MTWLYEYSSNLLKVNIFWYKLKFKYVLMFIVFKFNNLTIFEKKSWLDY